MSEPPGLRDLVGDDVPEEELAELARVDALLRSVPRRHPRCPRTLTESDHGAPLLAWRPRRLAIAVGIAAALAALSFGVGSWLSGGDDFDARGTIPMQATDNAQRPRALIRLGPPQGGGTWELELETKEPPEASRRGLLRPLALEGRGVCRHLRHLRGRLREDDQYRMNAPYRLADYDAWVVTAVLPGPERETLILPGS